jgi:Tfp pilus assembly protein PilF
MPTPTRHWRWCSRPNGAELADQHFRKALRPPADTRILNNYGSFLYEQGVCRR